MKIISWNINSVRLRLPLLLKLLAEQQPDVICLQETKVVNELFPAEPLIEAGYPHQLLNGMKAYNGVAILARQPLQRLDVPAWCGKHDARHIAGQLDNGLTIHNFYVPAGGDIPDVALNDKFAHKLAFLDEVTSWFGATTNRTQQVLVGDLNIAPLPDDVWSHKQLLDVVSHTPVEVERMVNWQATLNWVDTHRELVPAPAKLYSWWSYRAADWQAANRGRRLDHIWTTPDLKPQLHSGGVLSDYRAEVQPSDHAPIWAQLDL